LGAPYRIACGYAMISVSVFQKWMNQEPEFAEEVQEARAVAAMQMMQHIQYAAPSDWRAAARMLEMMHPQDFNNSRVELTGAEGGAISVDYRGQLLEKLAQLALQEQDKKTAEAEDADGTEGTEGGVPSPFVGLSGPEGSNGSDSQPEPEGG
jgi:hypothetical protein